MTVSHFVSPDVQMHDSVASLSKSDKTVSQFVSPDRSDDNFFAFREPSPKMMAVSTISFDHGLRGHAHAKVRERSSSTKQRTKTWSAAGAPRCNADLDPLTLHVGNP